MRDTDEQYFARIESELENAIGVATAARRQGEDPRPEVEIPVAQDMADRVENILGIAGVAARVRELETDHSREETALELARDFADGSVGEFDSKEGKIEGAVRTAVALLTEGVVAAPIEGIDRVEITTTGAGEDFVRIYYAGPIRSAGGTAQALSVLVADYTRSLLDVGEYVARDDEIERYAEEVALYDDEVGLQYSPKHAETKFIAEHCPIMLDGEATGEGEVQGYRDLDRVGTNSPRGGMCLVLAEGIALKAPKIQRYTDQLAAVDWPWLQELIDGTVGSDASTEPATTADEPRETESAGPVEPTGKYLRDLIAGRPVFGHPSQPGGFRLRYGRARNHGFATAGVHPATMHLVDDFLATGTQLKTERPGKAAGVVPVDTIEGPTVRLADGRVLRIDDAETAKRLRNGVETILDLGEYLVNAGEFVENNHPLVPGSYCSEWWLREMDDAGADVQALEDSPYVDLENPSADQVLAWTRDHDAPLHPAYTYLWHDISVAALDRLADAVAEATPRSDETGRPATADGGATTAAIDPADAGTLAIEADPEIRDCLETLLVEHRPGENGRILVDDWVLLARSLGLTPDLERAWDPGDLPAAARNADDALPAVQAVAPFEVRARAPTRIGCRMGRPEKSEERSLSPAVHTLFPIGEAGGEQRDVGAASKQVSGLGEAPGEISVQMGERRCPDCARPTPRVRCPDCETRTEPIFECEDCGIETAADDSGRVECPRCGRYVSGFRWWDFDLRDRYRTALDRVDERENAFEILKGVKGLSSASKVPEPLEKGILRAKHGVSAFKDGTVRYDMTDLPLTSVRPAEIGVGAEQLRALGYDTDVHGEPLRHDDQLVHLRVQDVVISDGAADHLLRTANFVDDLLESYYDEAPYYGAENRDDLVGELVFGLAPHTSAAVVGRVVGFTAAAVGYAHPYFHAAKRRNCFHPATTIEYRSPTGEVCESIGSLVDGRLDRAAPAAIETDDVGTEILPMAGDLTLTSVAGSGELVERSITALSRHPAPDHLVRIRTRAGRSLTVTPDHELLVWGGDGPQSVPAAELDVGDPLLARSDSPMASPATGLAPGAAIHDGGTSVAVDRIAGLDYRESDLDHTYCLTVEGTHTLFANGIASRQCDGDEDCVMLLMDGLLNFSKQYLPDRRGGRMDAPLVMSSRVDPAEIDDEAHNVDDHSGYPLEFYEATRRLADPESVDVQLAGDSVRTDAEYAGLANTHDTSGIAEGPALSAYKTLEAMETKMDAQLELARKLRAVDEADVAERIIEYHFLPDLIGNLRAFASQQVRCLDCGESFRRPPLSGSCRVCGGTVNLTVHEGSVEKYMDTAQRVAREYGAREYTAQRLDILEGTLTSLFENDKNRPSSLGDFM